MEENIPLLWGNNLMHYTINLLSASTGMRMGEIQGLTVKAVKAGRVEILHAWERNYGLKEPKYGSFRIVPIPPKTVLYLQDYIQNNKFNSPEDLVFYGNDRNKPIGNKSISKWLYKALTGIGINYKKGERRTITFYSWRHFFNNAMRGKIPDYKIQQLTGHKTQAMTDHYTNFDNTDFEDVKLLQDELFIRNKEAVQRSS